MHNIIPSNNVDLKEIVLRIHNVKLIYTMSNPLIQQH